MTTALTLIESSMRLAGILGEGEAIGGTEGSVALSALNQMLDSWSIMRLNVYATQNQQFTWPAATATRTVGATGQLVGIRPIEVSPTSYYVSANVSYPLKVITQSEYDSIANKTATNTVPEYLAVNMTDTNATLTMYPVPSSSVELHLVSVLELTQPATLGTTITVPPGYLRLFRYSLAVELCAEFGFDVPALVSKIAASSMRAVKRINSKATDKEISMPFALTRRHSNINIG